MDKPRHAQRPSLRLIIRLLFAALVLGPLLRPAPSNVQSGPAGRSVISAEVSERDKARGIETFVRAYHDRQTFNGSVLAAESGRVIFKAGFGLANREWNIPNAPDTKFRIGSMTKQFTSLLIMQLVQEKKIDLQAKLSTYLPFYRKDVGGRVTIHHLLTHTSGIPSYTDDLAQMAEVIRDPFPPAEFVAKYCSGDLQFKPGSEFRYDNSGYFILGAVIEAVTGKPYEDVLKERIFVPLGMKDSGYDRPVPVLAKRASGYAVTFDGLENSRYVNMSLPYAAGALYSTVEDLYLWDRALAGDRLLSGESKAVLFEPHVAMRGGTAYGYGWMVRTRAVSGSEAKTKSMLHGGTIFGFNSYIERLPDKGQLVVILSNTPEADLGAMADGIFDIMYGQKPTLPKKSLTREIYEALVSRGTAEAVRLYREIKATRPDDYEFGPRDLDELGYHLLNAKRMTAAAVEVFKLNVAEFPKYANGYDSLGEAYLAAGDKEQAAINYAKSLELDPSNANAAAKLAELKTN